MAVETLQCTISWMEMFGKCETCTIRWGAPFHFSFSRDVTYQHGKRNAAKWKKNDIITMRVYTLAPRDFPANGIQSRWKGGTKQSSRDPHRPAVMLTQEQYDAGIRVFVDFYKNGIQVYSPIRVDAGPGVPCYIACKLCELKDCVEIVKTPELIEPQKRQ